MNNTVSVIIPVYKVEAYLAQCVRSVLDQTYRELEVILVDDGSPDNCPAMCDAFAQADSRVKVIHKENGGLSSARNAGLTAATGDYVMYIDSDDWTDTDVIEKAVDMAVRESLDVVMWSYKSERAGSSFERSLFGPADMVWKGDDVRAVCRRIVGLTGEALRDPQKVFSCDTAWGKLYRHELIRGIEFVDTKKIGTEDALYNLYVFARVTSAGYLGGVFNHYRKDNETSLTTVYKSTLVERWQTLYGMMADFLRESQADADTVDALSNRIALSMLGIGLNEVHAPVGFFRRAARIRSVLKTEPWKTAVKRLPMSYFPLKWHVFFRLCKWRWTELLLLMLLVIVRLRDSHAS